MPVGRAAPGDDPAMDAPVVNTSPGPEYGDDTRRFQGIPGIERAPNGRLWATWYAGGPGEGPENYVLVSTSGDDGAAWSRPALVIDPPGTVRAFDPCLWHDPQGRLWLFWAQAYYRWDGRGGVWAIVSENPDAERPEWSQPRRLCNGIMMNKPVVLTTGEWVLPAAVWTHTPNCDEPRHVHDLGDEVGVNAIHSTDRGDTWSLLGRTRVPNSACDEPMLVERKDGSLWMLVRTEYGIGESISTDRGRTWTPGKPSDIEHIPAARFFIRRLKSGRLLLVKHNPPDGKTRSHLTAFLSDDDGAAWRGGLVIDERAKVSYPDGVQAPEGTIYVVYDRNRYADKEIVMAAFEEEDVARGRFSPSARSRILINQATAASEPA